MMLCLRNTIVVLVVLALPFSVTAIRMERRKFQGLGQDAGEERSLKGDGQCENNQDVLEEYYNALFELDDKPGWFHNCTDDNYFEIGEHIRDIVEEVDRIFPDIEEDVIKIKTEVCEMPCVWGDDDAAATTDRRHRALGTSSYTYKSGGICRRCKSRRRLNNLLVKKPRRLGEYDGVSPSELATKACEFAHVSKLAMDDCERALDTVESRIDDMEALDETAVDPEEVIKKCEDVEKNAEEMTKTMEDMLEYILQAEQACSDAEQAAANNDQEKTEDAIEEAEKCTKKVMGYVEVVHKESIDALMTQKALEEKVLQAAAKKNQERTKHAIEKMEGKNKLKLEQLDEEIDHAEKAMKEAKSLGAAIKINHLKTTVEDLKLRQKLQKKALAAAEKEYQEMIKADAEYTEKVASLLLTARYAKNEEEWMGAYKDMLEEVIPYELKLRYNSTTPYEGELGCIDARNDGDMFEVKVILDQKDEKDDTLIRTCKRGGPEECDDDCQQYYPDYASPP